MRRRCDDCKKVFKNKEDLVTHLKKKLAKLDLQTITVEKQLSDLRVESYE